jgi:hypothetical protein
MRWMSWNSVSVICTSDASDSIAGTDDMRIPLSQALDDAPDRLTHRTVSPRSMRRA